MSVDFKQPSTWRGLLGMLAAAGIAINPQWFDIIALLLGAGVSAIEILRDERNGG